ncbi:MAG: methyltransferase domain-containing protein [Desulfurellales bacterium]|nr:MAG: methyltransferase domain-containing protein [Desulfurellales bacterium]
MKLNLGCGKHRLDGFVNVDLTGSDQDVDLSVFPWPWEDGTVEEIVASHVLEHFSKEGGRTFIEECHRVLSEGGVLHIAVPDMDKFINAHLTGDFSPLKGYKWTDLNHLCGGDETEHNPAQRHKYMYSFESLAYTLDNEGFPTVWYLAFPRDCDNLDYEAISLYVTAVKL